MTTIFLKRQYSHSRQKRFTRLLEFIKLYKQNPLQIFKKNFFTIYQNYTLALIFKTVWSLSKECSIMLLKKTSAHLKEIVSTCGVTLDVKVREGQSDDLGASSRDQILTRLLVGVGVGEVRGANGARGSSEDSSTRWNTRKKGDSEMLNENSEHFHLFLVLKN